MTTTPTTLLTPLGSAGEVLTSNGLGSPPTYQAIPTQPASTTSPWNYEPEVNATGVGATITLASGLSGVNEFIIITKDQAATGSNILIRLGDAGGIETSGYKSVLTYRANNSSATIRIEPLSDEGFRFQGTTWPYSFCHFVLQDPASNEWHMQGTIETNSTNATLAPFIGHKNLSGELTQIAINRQGGGSYTTGSWSVMWR